MFLFCLHFNNSPKLIKICLFRLQSWRLSTLFGKTYFAGGRPWNLIYYLFWRLLIVENRRKIEIDVPAQMDFLLITWTFNRGKFLGLRKTLILGGLYSVTRFLFSERFFARHFETSSEIGRLARHCIFSKRKKSAWEYRMEVVRKTAGPSTGGGSPRFKILGPLHERKKIQVFQTACKSVDVLSSIWMSVSSIRTNLEFLL